MRRSALVAFASGGLILLPAGAALSRTGLRGPDAGTRCFAAPVKQGRVHAGPFTGEVGSRYTFNGRFRLYDLVHPAGTTRLTNKMAWFLPRKRAAEAPWLSVKGVRLAPSGRVFRDQLAEIFGSGFPEGKHSYASNLEPPTAGCWRLTFKTGKVSGSLVVLVRNG